MTHLSDWIKVESDSGTRWMRVVTGNLFKGFYPCKIYCIKTDEGYFHLGLIYNLKKTLYSTRQKLIEEKRIEDKNLNILKLKIDMHLVKMGYIMRLPGF